MSSSQMLQTFILHNITIHELFQLILILKLQHMNHTITLTSTQPNQPPQLIRQTSLHYIQTYTHSNPYRRTLEKTNFLPEPHHNHKKDRNVGRIIRNYSNPSAQKENTNLPTQVTAQKSNMQEKYHTNLQQKISHSHFTPTKVSLNIDKSRIWGILNEVERGPQLSRQRSNPTSYDTANYDKRINYYQLKREKIDQQIRNIKRVTIDVDAHLPSPYAGLSQTPKFANSLNNSTKMIRSNKVKEFPSCKWEDFLNKIKLQMSLYQKLRFLKHEVRSQDKNKIIEELKSKYKIDKDIVTLDNQQFDPFYDRTAKLNVQNLTKAIASAFESAQNYWNGNLKNSFEKQVLNDLFCCFEGQSEKGCVSLKGFVRELGVLLQNQKYLRNRDVYLIFKKIQPFTREKFFSELGRSKQAGSVN